MKSPELEAVCSSYIQPAKMLSPPEPRTPTAQSLRSNPFEDPDRISAASSTTGSSPAHASFVSLPSGNGRRASIEFKSYRLKEPYVSDPLVVRSVIDTVLQDIRSLGKMINGSRNTGEAGGSSRFSQSSEYYSVATSTSQPFINYQRTRYDVTCTILSGADNV